MTCVFTQKTENVISIIKDMSTSRWFWRYFIHLRVIYKCRSLPLPSISESFLTVKGAALFLPRGNGSSASSTSRFSQLRSKHAGKYCKCALINSIIKPDLTDLLCFFHTRRHTAASTNHVYSPQTRGQHQTGGQTDIHTHTCLFTDLNARLPFLLFQAVRLESIHPQITRYMVVVSTNGRQDTEESVVLGMDFSPRDG